MNRRHLLTAAAASVTLPGVTMADGAGQSASPDADLVRLCAEHIVNRDAFNASSCDADDDEPLWVAYCRTKRAITASQPQTLDGLRAKALAAKTEATLPNGTEDPEGTPAATWAWSIVNDLVAGRAGT